MTQTAFAAAMGVNQATISRWEKGAATPSEPTIRYARSLLKDRDLPPLESTAQPPEAAE